MTPFVSPRRASFRFCTTIAALICAVGAVPAIAHAPVPSAPVNAVANPLSTTQIEIKWVKTETDDTTFVIEEFVANAWKTVRSTKKNLQQATLTGLAPGSLHLYRVSAKNKNGQSPPSNTTGAMTDKIVSPVTCSPSTDICLDGGRFKIESQFRPFGQGQVFQAGDGEVIRPDTGLLWFFGSNNVELVVRVLNGCQLNTRYWVFAGGLTNVEVLLTVTDTHAGRARTYYNPLGRQFQAVTDTSALATCP